MIPQTISNEEVNQLPLIRFEGKIHVIQDLKAAKKAVKELLKHPVLGFDTESPPAFKKSEKFLPSLIQFATNEEVYLFQISHLENIQWALPLLTKESPLKVGIALHDDIIDLKQIDPFKEKGFFNIPQLSQQLGIVNTGLRKLTAIILKSRISKGAQVSN
jgi:ribonuclease D